MRVAPSYYTDAVMLITGHADDAVVLYGDWLAVRLFLPKTLTPFPLLSSAAATESKYYNPLPAGGEEPRHRKNSHVRREKWQRAVNSSPGVEQQIQESISP